jgi:hypothetical protein
MNFVGTYAPEIRSAAKPLMLVECKGADSAAVTVMWPVSNGEVNCWTMTGKLDTETLTVDYTDGVHKTLLYGEDGKIASETGIYENGKGRVIFQQTPNTVTWIDEQDHVADELSFAFVVPQAAEDLDWAIRSGASPEAVRQIDEDYARLIGTMAVEQNKTISELSKAQERQLNLLREQKAHAEQAIREGRSLNGETKRVAEEISKAVATDTSDNDYSGPFDVRALDESAAEYVETYAVALNKIEQMAYEHHVRMSNIGTAYGFGGLAASANQVDLSGFATSVTNALTTAIGNMRVTCGTTIVVENMTVREEADIRRISRELNRMMEHSANARGGAR